MKRLLHVKCTEHTDTPPFKDFSIKYYTIASGYFYFRENSELGFFFIKMLHKVYYTYSTVLLSVGF